MKYNFLPRISKGRSFLLEENMQSDSNSSDLKEKSRKSLGGKLAALCALPVFVFGGGCLGHINELDVAGALLQGSAISNPNNKQRVLGGLAGKVISNAGERQHQQELARTPRNINLNQNRRQNTNSTNYNSIDDLPLVITMDKNKENFGKRVFHLGETVFTVVNLSKLEYPQGSKIGLNTIYCRTGENLFEKSPELRNNPEVMTIETDSNSLLKKFGLGEYISELYICVNGDKAKIGEVDYILTK